MFVAGLIAGVFAGAVVGVILCCFAYADAENLRKYYQQSRDEVVKQAREEERRKIVSLIQGESKCA